MKKLKLFALAAGLVSAAAGVFAGKSRFFTGFYAYNFNTCTVCHVLNTVPNDVTGIASPGQQPISGTDESGVAVCTLTYYHPTTGLYCPYYWAL